MKKLNMRKNTTEGFLITFCGLDGCGKTTMIERLVAELQKDNRIFLTKQPTGAVRNSQIFRAYMDTPDHDMYDYRSLSLLAASDRIQHSNKEIEPAMKEGKVVISDRYFYSCIANLRARGFYKDKWIYEVARSIIKPDVAFFLDVPIDTAIRRVRSRADERDRYIDIELQKKLRSEYIRLCKANNGILIRSDISEEKCFEVVRDAVERRIKNGN